jgi:hypothetical protein
MRKGRGGEKNFLKDKPEQPLNSLNRVKCRL